MNDIQEYQPFRGLPTGSKLLLAFSGGVDSTIAAMLSKQAGMEVLAVNMRLLEQTGPDGSEPIQKAAEALGLELHFLDLQDDFKQRVMRPCWEEYACGRTPNPCTICNPIFKFGELMRYAKAHGCAGMATGHYARIVCEHGICSMLRGCHKEKDQTYFMYGLTQAQLAFSYMPLGALTKVEVRAMAAELHLPNAHAAESQDACFTPSSGTLSEYLRNLFHAQSHPGNFIDSDSGKKLGCHQGIHSYTIGQRKGTGVALGKPAYVQKISGETGTVYLTGDNQKLFAQELVLTDPHWQSGTAPSQGEFRGDVQIRYRSKAAPALIRMEEDGHTLRIRFDIPQRAVTPGQAAVIYNGDHLLGGAKIS